MSRRALLEGWRPGDHPRVKRSGASYQQTYDFVRAEIQRHVDRYRTLETHDQTARLIRDEIDDLLRRYHEYCIEQSQGAHYRQVGLAEGEVTEFEHAVPAKVARDAVLSGRMTIDDALNIPTCVLSQSKHRELAAQGLARTTPDTYWFWRRYQNLGIEVVTRDGVKINMNDWNLDDHYQHFA